MNSSSRVKVYKRAGEWVAQRYGANVGIASTNFEWAMLLATGKVKGHMRNARNLPVLLAEEGRCFFCGRRTETHESVVPGGAHYTEVCTHCEQEVGSWSV